MKRSLPSMIAGAVIVGILLLYMITFQVRFTEVAVVRTFGKADRSDVITEPGLKWKWPWPIQEVDKYDNRIHIALTTGEEMPTGDKKNVIITTAIGWRIEDPYLFSISCVNKKDGEKKLKIQVRDEQKTVIGRYEFGELVSTEPDKLKYDDIEDEILAAVAPKVKKFYGIRAESIGISKLALPSQITQTVFEAMKKERQADAARYTSEGESKAKEITDTAESIAGTILAFAQSKADEIRAKGMEQAAEYNKIFSQDEELAMFLLDIKNMVSLLKGRSTIVLDADQRPFYLVNDSKLPEAAGAGMPLLKQRGSNTATRTPPPGVTKPK